MLELIPLLLGALLASTSGDLPSRTGEAAAANPALVIAVRGEVTTSPNIRAEKSLAQPLDSVSEGATLRMGKNARLDLLFDYRWFTFVGTGDLRLQKNRWTHPGAIRRVRSREMPDHLPAQDLDHWSVTPEREPAQALTIESPRETAIRDPKPTLRWRSSQAQQTFRLDLLAVNDGRLELVESWRGLQNRELRVHRDLKPETLYFWRVAHEGTEPRAEDSAWFIVRGATKLKALDDWVQSLDALRSSDDEDRHVAESLLAIGLERSGLLEEARSSWRALASQGRILDIATKRSVHLARRALREPRDHPILPLPFQMRLHVKAATQNEVIP